MEYLGYLFSFLILISAFGVVFAKNHVHNVLCLIFTFINAAGLFILLGAEFLAMVLIIVYVGAVAVLFLFVIMMLDVDFNAMKKSIGKAQMTSSILTAVLLTGNICFIIFVSTNQGFEGEDIRLHYDIKSFITHDISIHDDIYDDKTLDEKTPHMMQTNTEQIASVLYDKYFIPFQISGILLFVAMLGGVSLTLNKKKKARRQNAFTQISRSIQDSIQMQMVEKNIGVNDIDYGDNAPDSGNEAGNKDKEV